MNHRWRKRTTQDHLPRKELSDSDDFYASLKSQVSQTRAEENDEATRTIDLESSDMTTKDKLLNTIKVIDTQISSLKRKTLIHLINLGNI